MISLILQKMLYGVPSVKNTRGNGVDLYFDDYYDTKGTYFSQSWSVSFLWTFTLISLVWLIIKMLLSSPSSSPSSSKGTEEGKTHDDQIKPFRPDVIQIDYLSVANSLVSIYEKIKQEIPDEMTLQNSGTTVAEVKFITLFRSEMRIHLDGRHKKDAVFEGVNHARNMAAITIGINADLVDMKPWLCMASLLRIQKYINLCLEKKRMGDRSFVDDIIEGLTSDPIRVIEIFVEGDAEVKLMMANQSSFVETLIEMLS